jgi:undecaprenyl-diphosphatase
VPVTSRRTALAGAVVMGVVFAALAAAVTARGGSPFGVDTDLHRWAAAHRSSGLTTAARVVTATGTGLIAYLLAAAAGGLAGGRRRWWVGAMLAVAVLASCETVRLAVSVAIGRSRPPQPDWATAASGYAFPSGHTTSATVVAALLCVAVVLRGPGARWGPAACGAAATWAVTVGVTRVYLGVHWPTDVVGGWLLGTALSAGTWALLSGRIRRRTTGRVP